MFGNSLAMLYESLSTPKPSAAASSSLATNPVTRLTTVATAIDPDALANDGPGSAGADAAGAGATEDTGGRPGAGGSGFIGGTPTSTPLQLPIAQGGAATAFDGAQHPRSSELDRRN